MYFLIIYIHYGNPYFKKLLEIYNKNYYSLSVLLLNFQQFRHKNKKSHPHGRLFKYLKD